MSAAKATWTPDLLRAAHMHSSKHRGEVESSLLCGCFSCHARFKPREIDRWLSEGDGTALCPACGIDSVIGDASGYPVADDEFLKAMQTHWFERVVYVGD